MTGTKYMNFNDHLIYFNIFNKPIQLKSYSQSWVTELILMINTCNSTIKYPLVGLIYSDNSLSSACE